MPRASTVSIHPPTDNHLLALLSTETFERLSPHLEAVTLPLGKAIYESGDRMRHILFPTEGIVSLLSVMENGSSAEIAVCGNEGLVGISLFMGGESTTSRAIVQSAGQAYRLAARTMNLEFERGGDLQYVVLRYTQALITQMAQTAVCNRHHTVDSNCAAGCFLASTDCRATTWP